MDRVGRHGPEVGRVPRHARCPGNITYGRHGWPARNTRHTIALGEYVNAFVGSGLPTVRGGTSSMMLPISASRGFAR